MLVGNVWKNEIWFAEVDDSAKIDLGAGAFTAKTTTLLQAKAVGKPLAAESVANLSVVTPINGGKV